MNSNGKKRLIRSLSSAIQEWIDLTDPNSNESTDVGFVGDGFTEKLASLVVTALEINSDSQRLMEQDGLMK